MTFKCTVLFAESKILGFIVQSAAWAFVFGAFGANDGVVLPSRKSNPTILQRPAASLRFLECKTKFQRPVSACFDYNMHFNDSTAISKSQSVEVLCCP